MASKKKDVAQEPAPEERDEAPALRPRLGGRVREERVPTFRNSVLARQRAFSRDAPGGREKGARGGHPSRGKAACDVPAPGKWDRRVAVKASVVRMGDYGKKAARLHLQYIQRDGVQEDGSPGVLYGREGLADAEPFLAEREGEPHQFRLIISPEDGHELNLDEFVPRLIAQMERDLGRRLDWVAANHHNTDQPHAHVVIRGLALDGKELRMDRQYVSNGIRWRAQQLATAELGLRNVFEVQAQLTNEVGQERYTSLDRELERLSRDTPGRVILAAPLKSAEARLAHNRHIGRLDTLERLGLAKKTSPGRWTLTEGWVQKLRALGERHDIIKRMHQGLKGDPARYRIIRGPDDVPGPVEGVVRKRGLHDELAGTHFALVETAAGEGFYVPLKGLVEDVREGDIVSVQVPRKVLTEADRQIERLAQQAGGVYSPKAHLRDIAADTALSPTAKRALEPEEAVEACEKRLARLEKLGLAARLPDGTWRVTPGLVARLEAGGEDVAALQRPRVERRSPPLPLQRLYRGPTWLDTVKAPDVLAPYGLGAELTEALRARRLFLRSLGIDPDAGDKALAALKRLEVSDLGARLAQEQGAEYVGQLPKTGWRGKVKLLPPQPVSGRRLAQVFDGHRFVLLPATRDLRDLEGQKAEVSRENSELVVRRAGPRRGA